MRFDGFFSITCPCEGNCICDDGGEKNVTVGRKKRKRRKGAGTGVKVRPHTRSPRGPNRGKKRVRVDPYKRGSGASKRKSRRKRR